MYFIDFRPFGYEVMFSGKLTSNELVAWLDDARLVLPEEPKDFGLLVDLRLLAPLDPPAIRLLGQGLRLFQEKGLRRSAVIVGSPAIRREFTRQARMSGIAHWERYLCPEESPDWRGRCVAWIREGVDPDVEDAPLRR
jgi:hypothetical protein